MDVLGIDIRKDPWELVHLNGSFTGPKVKKHLSLSGEVDERLAFLESYISRKGAKNLRIALAVPSVSKALEVPVASLKDLEKALRFEIEKHIPFENESSYCFQVIGKTKKGFSVLLSVVKKSALAEAISGFTRSGLENVYAFPWHAGYYNALFHGRKASGKTAAFFHPFGDHAAFDVFYGPFPVYSKTLKADAQGRWPDIVEREARFALSHVEELTEKKAVSELYIVADEGIENWFPGQESGIPLKALCGKEPGFPAAAYAAFGAAYAASGKARLNACFPPVPERRFEGRHTIRALSASVAALLFVTAVSYPLKDRVSLMRIERSLSGIEAEKEQMDKLRDDLLALDTRIKAIERIKGAQTPGVLDMLKEVTVLSPESTWLTALEYDNDVVQMEGYSDRASKLLLQLGQSGLMRDVEFAGPVVKASGKELFRIKTRLTNGKTKGMEKGGRG